MNYTAKAGFVYRAFYYLRKGYRLYLSFPLTLANTVVLLYYFAIRGTSFLWLTQHKFIVFTIVLVGILLPLAGFFGWLHLQRLPTYAAEADLNVEANPYYYKLMPGIQREVGAVAWVAFARASRLLLENEGLLTEEDDKISKKIIEQAERLRRGEPIY